MCWIRRAASLLLFALFVFFVANPAFAHPVPRRNHDRLIVVRLTPEAVVVSYHLEVEEFTAVFHDLPPFDVDLSGKKPQEVYDIYTEKYAPIFADNLVAKLDGKPLKFTCVERKHVVLDSLQCDFTFRAPWQPELGRRYTFAFLEGNYAFPDPDHGQIDLSLAAGPGITVVERSEPDKELKARPYTELKPGDDERLRKVSATFEVGAAAPAESSSPTTDKEEARPAESSNALTALLDSRHGIVLLLALAAVFGAAHALTPGHGKTLVAAYLVGERGTVWHALLLGLVTTLTHTGAVLVLAGVLPVFFPNVLPANVQATLGLVGGLLIAGMGVWLLLRRLAGQADHVHLGGHDHHHAHDHTHAAPAADAGWWGLIVLGIQGGIVPCWDAILMLGLAISTQRLWLGLPLLLAFSAGLAGVLIAIGIAVVSVKGFAGSRMGESRLFRALPLISAVLVTGIGLWLCYESAQLSTAP